MKTLFEFELNKVVEVEETVEKVNEAGETVKETRTVKKDVPQKFAIKKPTRTLNDDADLYYAKELSNYIKSGILNHAMLQKRYNNDGGLLSENQKKEIESTRVRCLELLNKLKPIEDIKIEDRTQEQKDEREAYLNELEELQVKIQDYEMFQISVFEQSAESKSRNKTLLWWVLQLSLKFNKDKFEYVFGDGEYDKKLAKYDEINEGKDEFLVDAINRLAYLITVWQIGRLETEADFKEVLKNYKPNP